MVQLDVEMGRPVMVVVFVLMVMPRGTKEVSTIPCGCRDQCFLSIFRMAIFYNL